MAGDVEAPQPTQPTDAQQRHEAQMLGYVLGLFFFYVLHDALQERAFRRPGFEFGWFQGGNQSFEAASVSGRIDAVSTTLPRRASRRGRENSSRPSRSRIGHDAADVEPLENTSCVPISVVDFHTV